jgi:hypothetical protein
LIFGAEQKTQKAQRMMMEHLLGAHHDDVVKERYQHDAQKQNLAAEKYICFKMYSGVHGQSRAINKTEVRCENILSFPSQVENKYLESDPATSKILIHVLPECYIPASFMLQIKMLNLIVSKI